MAAERYPDIRSRWKTPILLVIPVRVYQWDAPLPQKLTYALEFATQVLVGSCTAELGMNRYLVDRCCSSIEQPVLSAINIERVWRVFQRLALKGATFPLKVSDGESCDATQLANGKTGSLCF
jgi:hypothetical protein